MHKCSIGLLERISFEPGYAIETATAHSGSALYAGRACVLSRGAAIAGASVGRDLARRRARLRRTLLSCFVFPRQSLNVASDFVVAPNLVLVIATLLLRM